MIDLHVHTTFSDGQLIPAELIQRYKSIGCEYLAITDHVDLSNIDFVVPRIAAIADEYSHAFNMTIFPGCELTHIPPQTFPVMVEKARALGARIVVAHGETPVEPVAEGTNRAAIMAGVTVLAHPGFISDDDVKLAAEKGVFLEITARGGHSLTNGHVCALAKQYGAKVIFSTDGHAPENLADRQWADRVLCGAGFTDDEVEQIWKDAYALCQNVST